MTFKTGALVFSEDTSSDHTPSTSPFAQALNFFNAVPTEKKAPQKIKNGERSPFLSFQNEPLFFPANESPFDFISFFEECPNLTIVYHSDYTTFQEICRKGKRLPARQYAIATIIRPHGGFDLHIRKELPKKHLSRIDDVASFIQLFPNGVPGVSAYFTFYLGDIDVRLQWWQTRGWNMRITRGSTGRYVGQMHARGSKILYPLIGHTDK